MVKFLLATVFVLYVFIAGISCAMFLLKNAEGDKGAGPTSNQRLID
jgi:hypothetical protein